MLLLNLADKLHMYDIRTGRYKHRSETEIFVRRLIAIALTIGFTFAFYLGGADLLRDIESQREQQANAVSEVQSLHPFTQGSSEQGAMMFTFIKEDFSAQDAETLCDSYGVAAVKDKVVICNLHSPGDLDVLASP